MKDYSKYFQNIESSDIDSSYGFITKLEIVGEEVHVWTPKTKKGEPRKYGIELLPFFQEKLEKQYQSIIDNEDVLKKAYTKKGISFAIFIATIAIVPLMALFKIPVINLSVLKAGLLISPILGAALAFLNEHIAHKKIKSEMKTYKDYLEKRIDIETLSQSDKNITENLNKSTTQRISSKEVMKENGITSQIYDIDFMDKTSLKQLRKLIANYNQSKSLFIEQEFINSNQTKEETKTRSLKK